MSGLQVQYITQQVLLIIIMVATFSLGQPPQVALSHLQYDYATIHIDIIWMTSQSTQVQHKCWLMEALRQVHYHLG